MILPSVAEPEPCDNGTNASNCEVQHTTIPTSPVILGIPSQIEISPINLTGDSSCSASDNACGFNVGTGPVAVAGDSSCTMLGSPNNPGTGCGYNGTGPIAVGGSSYCSATFGCGLQGTGPVAIGGDATCQGRCGWFGTAPIAIGGSATCATYATIPSGDGCGNDGTGPVAIGGGVLCRAGTGCGATATGPMAVGGAVDCKAGWGCGAQGTGVVAVGGDARCESTTGCGYLAPGPVSVGGDVYCTGTCGKRGEIIHGFPAPQPSVPRRGTPGVSVTGHAYCSEPLSVAGAASDPVGHPQDFECASPRDVAGL